MPKQIPLQIKDASIDYIRRLRMSVVTWMRCINIPSKIYNMPKNFFTFKKKQNMVIFIYLFIENRDYKMMSGG